MPTIDNDLYDALGDAWWAPGSPVATLRQINPVRSAYFAHAIAQLNGAAQAQTGRPLRVLDVGCGGGFLAESLARAGFQVTAVDRSASSIEVARRHARASGLAIQYDVADARLLPFADSSFDAVVSSDFLEHVSDHLDTIIAEQARVLRTGGVLGFDTINRTWQARLVLIWLAQDALRLLPPRLHTYELFVAIPRLLASLARHGVRVRELRGVVPAGHPLAFLRDQLTRRQSGGFRLGDNLSISYIGAGTKE